LPRQACGIAAGMSVTIAILGRQQLEGSDRPPGAEVVRTRALQSSGPRSTLQIRPQTEPHQQARKAGISSCAPRNRGGRVTGVHRLSGRDVGGIRRTRRQAIGIAWIRLLMDGAEERTMLGHQPRARRRNIGRAGGGGRDSKDLLRSSAEWTTGLSSPSTGSGDRTMFGFDLGLFSSFTIL